MKFSKSTVAHWKSIRFAVHRKVYALDAWSEFDELDDESKAALMTYFTGKSTRHMTIADPESHARRFEYRLESVPLAKIREQYPHSVPKTDDIQPYPFATRWPVLRFEDDIPEHWPKRRDLARGVGTIKDDWVDGTRRSTWKFIEDGWNRLGYQAQAGYTDIPFLTGRLKKQREVTASWFDQTEIPKVEVPDEPVVRDISPRVQDMYRTPSVEESDEEQDDRFVLEPTAFDLWSVAQKRVASSFGITLPDSLHSILRSIHGDGKQGLIVGGAVRDAMLGEQPKDIDVEVYGTDYDDLVNTLSNHGRVDLVGRSFGVIKFTDGNGETYDFSLPRRDSKAGTGHRDFEIDFDPTITPPEAASRRDFTMNAMAFNPLTGELHDYYGGKQDLANGVLRHTTDAFAEDPLRVLRGMQFASRFGLEIHPDTARFARNISDEYGSISKERVAEEFMKLTKGREPGKAIKYLQQTGWSKNFPALHNLYGIPQDAEHHPEGDVAAHTMHTMNAAARIAEREGLEGDDRATIILAAMAHDLGKATHTQIDANGRITSHGHDRAGADIARDLLDSIGIKPDITARVVPLVEAHMRHLNFNEDSDPKTVRRLASSIYPSTIGDLAMVMEADHSGRPPHPARLPEGAEHMMRLAEQSQVTDEPMKPLLLGRHVMPYFGKPGPHIGEVLKAAYEAQLEGHINTEEEAQSWLRNHMSKTASSDDFVDLEELDDASQQSLKAFFGGLSADRVFLNEPPISKTVQYDRSGNPVYEYDFRWSDDAAARHAARFEYRLQEVPTDAMKNAVLKAQNAEAIQIAKENGRRPSLWRDWDEYADAYYDEETQMGWTDPQYRRSNRWPVLQFTEAIPEHYAAGSYEDRPYKRIGRGKNDWRPAPWRLIEDGWHRLHSYVRSGHETVPVLTARLKSKSAAKKKSEYMYHTTEAKNLKKILKEGLKTRPIGKAQKGYTAEEYGDLTDRYYGKGRRPIYLSNKPWDERFKEIFENNPNWISDPDNEERAKNTPPTVTLKVDVTGLRKHPDLGTLQDMGAYIEDGRTMWFESKDEPEELFEWLDENGEMTLKDLFTEEASSAAHRFTETAAFFDDISPDRIQVVKSKKRSSTDYQQPSLFDAASVDERDREIERKTKEDERRRTSPLSDAFLFRNFTVERDYQKNRCMNNIMNCQHGGKMAPGHQMVLAIGRQDTPFAGLKFRFHRGDLCQERATDWLHEFIQRRAE